MTVSNFVKIWQVLTILHELIWRVLLILGHGVDVYQMFVLAYPLMLWTLFVACQIGVQPVKVILQQNQN